MKQNLVKLMEAELEKAETALAVKDIGNKVQDMMEDIAKLRVDSLIAVSETVKEQFGIEQGTAFFDTLDNLLGSLQDGMKNAKTEIDNQVAYLNGEEQMGSDMGGMPDMGPNDMDMDMDMGMNDTAGGGMGGGMDDMFGADPANIGGDEPLGRMKRESIQHLRKQITMLENKLKRTKRK